MGRTTPRSAIASFIRAVDRDDLVSAARYLQASPSQRRNTETLARELKTLIDRYFSQSLASISDSPDGALDDGLPVDRERVGPLVIGDSRTDVALVRVTDPQAGPVWLISSETLAQVPALQASLTRTWIERVMPAPLVSRVVFGISVAHWIVLAASLAGSFLLLVLIFRLLFAAARRIFHDAAYRLELDKWFAGVRWPALMALAIALHLISVRVLQFPLTFRIWYSRNGLVLFVIALAWLVRRVLTLAFARARSIVWGQHRASTQSLMLLIERAIKALVVILAGMTMLIIFGVDVTTALAGLGIIGVAVALGAQKTVENVLGGLFLLTDKVLAVGDLCRISDRMGWVEDITLRSVRLRTPDNTLVSVPAGELAQRGIENFATRSKILAQNIIRLRHGTSVEQLRRVLESIRALLNQNPLIETKTSRISLINFGSEAIELELFAYLLTADFAEFLAAREELLLRIASIVEAEGSGFALPTQFIYMDDNTEQPHRSQTAS